MKKIILFLLLFILSFALALSQTDDNGAPYFPLRVGNAFYYRCYEHDPGGTDSSFIVSRITSTKTLQGKRYYYCTNFLGTANNYYLRYDRASGSLVRYDSTASGCGYELAMFKLSANLGDSLGATCPGNYNTKCIRISDTTIFNLNTRTKVFNYSYYLINGYGFKYEVSFSRNIGGLSYYAETFTVHADHWKCDLLQGCRVNGVIRGDTIDHITPDYADSSRYFPLQVGNTFYYNYYPYINGTVTDTIWVVSRITGNINKNGKLYYIVSNFGGMYITANLYLRYDVNSGKLMIYDSTNSQCGYEKEFYNFAHIPKDSSIGNCAANLRQWCERIKDTTFFGLQTKFKQYYWMSGFGNYSAGKITNFVKDIGICTYGESTSGPGHSNGFTTYIKGARINGVVYGDTSNLIPPSYADSSRYFPLKIGNNYYYKRNYTYHSSIPDTTIYDSSYYIVRITDTTRLHGKLYYKMNSFISGTRNYFRHDLDSGFLFSYDSLSWCTNYPYEYKCLMLSSNANQDGSGTCWLNNYYSRCFQIHDTNAFGNSRKVKGYMTSWGGTSGGHYYTWLLKDIGVCQYEGYSYSNSFGYSATTKYRLIGAFVDGVKYGDTITTGIQMFSNVLPDKFELYQNYPNPFNPTTSIKYSVPSIGNRQSSMVTLKIFDILGKQIAILVNEKQSPRVYEVNWNATMYPSGVYFYTLESQSYRDTKKMLLIK